MTFCFPFCRYFRLVKRLFACATPSFGCDFSNVCCAKPPVVLLDKTRSVGYNRKEMNGSSNGGTTCARKEGKQGSVQFSVRCMRCVQASVMVALSVLHHPCQLQHRQIGEMLSVLHRRSVAGPGLGQPGGDMLTSSEGYGACSALAGRSIPSRTT